MGIGIANKIKNGVDTGEPCITVFVNRKLKLDNISQKDLIPKEIEGIITDVVSISGGIKATYNIITDPERLKRWRPAPGGVSVGHYRLNINGTPKSGTLGMWVKDKETGEPLMLSNWHVIANCGDCKKGDPIVQPGPGDGGRHPRDTIAYLDRWIDVEMLGRNLIEAKNNLRKILKNNKSPHFNTVDAALARPVSEDVVSWDILGIGRPEGITDEVEIWGEVIKSGRTTGVTTGKVIALDGIIFIDYPKGVALFKD